jgi:hypothetical protein
MDNKKAAENPLSLRNQGLGVVFSSFFVNFYFKNYVYLQILDMKGIPKDGRTS